MKFRCKICKNEFEKEAEILVHLTTTHGIPREMVEIAVFK